MRLTLRILLASLLAAAGLALVTSPANALSCIGVQSVAPRAAHIFTGKILDAEDGRILVDVGEIWRGGPVENRVWLSTELDGWWDGLKNGHIPDDYTSATTWLFMPSANDAGEQSVNPCSAWPTTTPEGANLRPASVRAPLTDASPVVAQTDQKPAIKQDKPDDDSTQRWVANGGAFAIALALVLVYRAVRRRRRTQPLG